MKEYQYVTVEGTTFFGTKMEGHREIIDRYSAKGYRYIGFIPTKMMGGNIEEMDLVFERDRD